MPTDTPRVVQNLSSYGQLGVLQRANADADQF